MADKIASANFGPTPFTLINSLKHKVNGVGPKLALAILSAMSAMEFVQNVHAGDSNGLVKIPGVGKKTAERLIIEMKDKLKDWQVDGVALASVENTASLAPQSDHVAEAISGLVALGYKPQAASLAISKIKEDSLPAASLIRLALKNM
jgi:Holliday junction DNA helicase RuvA